MERERANDFLKRHSDLEEKIPGIYTFILEADWREKYQLREDEAEYLVEIELRGRGGKGSPEAYTRELELYREQRQL